MNKQDRIDLKGVELTLGKHGEILARLDERSQNQDKRMDRTDRRSAGISTIVATFASVVIATLLNAVGWPRG